MTEQITADVAQTGLKQFDPIDYEKYEDAGASKSYAPPAPGKYTGRAPIIKDDGTDVISETNSFGRTQQGYLKLQLDPIEVLDAPQGPYQVRFTRLSGKKSANRNASQIVDFLRACGIAARPMNEQELRAACRMASGRTFQFSLTWEGYNKDTQTRYRLEDFPLDENAPADSGKRVPFIQDEFDSKKRWFANGAVRYFVSAIKDKA